MNTPRALFYARSEVGLQQVCTDLDMIGIRHRVSRAGGLLAIECELKYAVDADIIERMARRFSVDARLYLMPDPPPPEVPWRGGYRS